MSDLFDFSALLPSEDGTPPDEDDITADPVPDDPRTAERPDDWPTCEVCGDPIDWSGRGRRPKKCAEHRRRTPVSGTSSGPVTTRISRAHTDRLGRIELALGKQAVKVGAVTSKFLPVTGVTIVRRAENAASAIVKICANKPQYLDALEKVADFENVIDIAEFFAAVIVAVGVDMGQVHPEGLVAQMLDVTEAWREVEGIEASVIDVQDEPEYQPAGVGVVDRHTPVTPQFGPGILPTYQPIGAGV